MQNQIGGPGITLPVPQPLYPYPLNNGSQQAATNEISLASGCSVIIPPGEFNIDLGKYSVLQYQDPVNQPSITQSVGVWRTLRTVRGMFRLRSDGVNYRVLNPLGVPVAAVVTKGGATYTQAGTTVAPSSGNSTWQAIIGGRVNLSITSRGSGYGVAPVVNIAAPAGPGVAATAIAVLSTNTTLKTLTMINEGAGYASAPNVVITPSPFDPNVASGALVQTATAQALLTGSGTVSAILCTNNGATLGSTVPTLTITGGNNSATATALLCTTVTAITLSAVGSGSATGAIVTSSMGIPIAANVFQNPAVELTDFIPRPLQANLSYSATGVALAGSGVIADGGMFLGTALGVVISNAFENPAPAVTLTQGAVNDTVIIQAA